MQWNDCSVLVTGGTGSFGQHFTHVMLEEYRPRKLIVFSRDELKQGQMRKRFPNGSIRFFIGDVRDEERLELAMQDADVVVHAAALKQVPACEYNPFEAIKTNILGTQNVIRAALANDVEKAFFISTDKAANPINLYGATKLCAEKVFVQSNSYSGRVGCRFSCARYGNVVGSRGSVIPLFLEQRKNGVVTVTDERMTRFWITLDQGVRFVIRAIEMMGGGEIFVPKIPATSIGDLVEAIAPGTEVEVIGIRPGEKLHEVLVSEDEARHTMELDDMYVIQPLHPWWSTPDWPGARELPDGFSFTSQNNPRRLTAEEINALL